MTREAVRRRWSHTRYQFILSITRRAPAPAPPRANQCNRRFSICRCWKRWTISIRPMIPTVASLRLMRAPHHSPRRQSGRTVATPAHSRLAAVPLQRAGCQASGLTAVQSSNRPNPIGIAPVGVADPPHPQSVLSTISALPSEPRLIRWRYRLA